MKKKDWIVMGIIVAVASLALGAMLLFNRDTNEPTGVVVHGNRVLFYFDINKNDTYEFTGDYGTMHLEVKDGTFRVYDVECPNQICVNMGWLDKDSIFAQVGITCLPNNIAVLLETGE